MVNNGNGSSTLNNDPSLATDAISYSLLVFIILMVIYLFCKYHRCSTPQEVIIHNIHNI